MILRVGRQVGNELPWTRDRRENEEPPRPPRVRGGSDCQSG